MAYELQGTGNRREGIGKLKMFSLVRRVHELSSQPPAPDALRDTEVILLFYGLDSLFEGSGFSSPTQLSNSDWAIG